MKKMLIIGILALSATSFANSASVDHSAHNNTEIKSEKSGMMNQIHNLSPEQQKEYHAIHEKHMAKTKKIMLDLKEIDIQIQKEMLNEKSDSKKIGRLIDKKSILQADKEKEMLKFKLEVKDKFGIKMMDGMMGKGKKCKMMDKTA
jgi:Spy/CpxP family protein refolding chaperone